MAGRRPKEALKPWIFGEVALLPLGTGEIALIDARDAEWAGRWRWVGKMSEGAGPYVVRNRRKADGPGPVFVILHREFLGLVGPIIGDHRDGNTLDCRRANLRACTHAQNLKNRRRRRDSSTGLKGVSRTKYGRFRAVIMADGVRHSLGSYRDPAAAHAAYVEAAKRLHGEFASGG